MDAARCEQRRQRFSDLVMSHQQPLREHARLARRRDNAAFKRRRDIRHFAREPAEQCVVHDHIGRRDQQQHRPPQVVVGEARRQWYCIRLPLAPGGNCIPHTAPLRVDGRRLYGQVVALAALLVLPAGPAGARVVTSRRHGAAPLSSSG